MKKEKTISHRINKLTQVNFSNLKQTKKRTFKTLVIFLCSACRVVVFQIWERSLMVKYKILNGGLSIARQLEGLFYLQSMFVISKIYQATRRQRTWMAASTTLKIYSMHITNNRLEVK